MKSNKLKLINCPTLLLLIIVGIHPSAFASDLLMVGGAWSFPAESDQNPYGIDMYDEAVLLGGNGDPSQAVIRIFTTASSATSAESNGALWVQDFIDLYDQRYPNLTPDVEWIPFHIGNCADTKNQVNSSIIDGINESNTIIFGGGDQSLITECFFNEDSVNQTRTTTPVFDALVNHFETNDIVIAGTSAGTTVQSPVPMITEGESYEALLDDPTALVGSPPIVRDLYYNPLGGFGLFPYGILDTHFSARGRQGRLVRLAAETNTSMAFGIDENTGLLVTNVGQANVSMEVLGERGVTIFDLSNASDEETNGYFGIKDVKVSYLTQGDFYNPITKAATFPTKSSLTCNPIIPAKGSNDIFSYRSSPGENGTRENPREFVEVAISLFESCETRTEGISFEQTPPFQVTMMENPLLGSQGYTGVDDQGSLRTSFVNLNMNIQAVPEGNLTLGLLGIGIIGFFGRRKT